MAPPETECFWKQEVESAKSPQATARILPGEPAPLSLSLPSGFDRPLQSAILRSFTRVPSIPCYSGSEGGVVLDNVLGYLGGAKRWANATLRMRVQNVWSQHRQGKARAYLGKDNYAFSVRGVNEIQRNTKLRYSAETDTLTPLLSLPNFTASSLKTCVSNLRQSARACLSLTREVPYHQLRTELGLNQRHVDCRGRYWTVPSSETVDISSKLPAWGSVDSLGSVALSYRLGIVKSGPAYLDSGERRPSEAAPGRRHAQGSAELSHTLGWWRPAGPAEGGGGGAGGGRAPYGAVLHRPRLTLASTLGGLLRAPLGAPSPGPCTVHPYSSGTLTLQVGQFVRPFLDFTRASVHIASGCAPLQPPASPDRPGTGKESAPLNHNTAPERDFTHQLTASLSQQIAGPLRCRADARWAYDAASGPWGALAPLETVYGLDCALPPGGAARFVVWYNPTKKEGIAEVRWLES